MRSASVRPSVHVNVRARASRPSASRATTSNATRLADGNGIAAATVPRVVGAKAMGVSVPDARSRAASAVIGVPSPPAVSAASKRIAPASARTRASATWGSAQSRTSRRVTGWLRSVSSSGSVTSRVQRPSTTNA